MKIELLKNAFAGTVEGKAAAAPATAIVPRKRRHLPVAARQLEAVSPATRVSDETLLATAAAVYDPRRLSRDAFRGVVEIMCDGGQVSRGERDLLLARLGLAGPAGYGVDDEAPRDMFAILRCRAEDSIAEMKMYLILESLAEHRRLAA